MSSSQNFDLAFKCSNFQEICGSISVYPSMTVELLKKALIDQFLQLKNKTLILIRIGKILSDTETLEQIGISSSSSEFIVVHALSTKNEEKKDEKGGSSYCRVQVVDSVTKRLIGEFEHCPVDSIFLLKEQICKKIGLIPQNILLHLHGYHLENSQTFVDRNIQTGQTLKLSYCWPNVVDRNDEPPVYGSK